MGKSTARTKTGYTLKRKRSPEMVRILGSVPSLAWLAHQIGICKQAVSRWHRVPLERVREVEAITGIPAHEIRPDTFEPPSALQPASPSPKKIARAM